MATDLAIMNGGRLLAHAAPEALLRLAAGRVWEWLAPSADLPAVRQRHLISSALRRSEGVQVRVVAAAAPHPAARAVEPTLEDAYLLTVQGGRDPGPRPSAGAALAPAARPSLTQEA